MTSFLSASAAGSRKAFDEIAREDGGVFLRAGFGRGDHHALGFLQNRNRAAAGAGHVDDGLLRRDFVQQRGEFAWR